MRVLSQPNTELFGEAIDIPIQWATTPVYKYNPSLKMSVWEEDKPDPKHYIEFIGGKHYVIDKGCCRLCTKPITPYTQKYYQKHYESGTKYSLLFDCEHFYCEECAKKEASKDYFTDILPAEVNRFESMRDGELVETVVFEDGSRLEEMTSRERALQFPGIY